MKVFATKVLCTFAVARIVINPRTQRPMLVDHGGYQYSKTGQHNNTTYWKCKDNRKNVVHSCKARAIVEDGNVVLKGSSHTCDPRRHRKQIVITDPEVLIRLNTKSSERFLI